MPDGRRLEERPRAPLAALEDLIRAPGAEGGCPAAQPDCSAVRPAQGPRAAGATQGFQEVKVVYGNGLGEELEWFALWLRYPSRGSPWETTPCGATCAPSGGYTGS